MSGGTYNVLEWMGGLLDQAALAVSPRWGAARIMSRRIIANSLRDQSRNAHHDGATTDRLNSPDRWLGSRLSADSGLEMDRDELVDHSRELYRTDSIGGAIDLDLEHVVGTGFILSAKADPLHASATEVEKFNKEIERVARDWSARADRTGKRSLWSLTRQAWRSFRYDGEIVAVLSDIGRADKPIPLCVQLIDGQRLETPPQHAANPLVRMGVEYNEGGDIVAYWIRRTHPYDTKQVDLKYDRVPAERVIHIFDPWFVGQSRGYPWFTRVINRLRDSKDLDEAGIIAAQIEACYAAFVKTKSPGPLARRTSTETDAKGNKLQSIRPGTINYIGHDDDIVFGSPQRQNSVGGLQELNYRRIATGINKPYEMLMRDWRGLSFAGGRLVLSGERLTVKSAQQMLAEAWFAAIWHRIVEESVIVGAVSLEPRAFEREPLAWKNHRATPPAWPYSITPGEEVDADIAAMDANMKTLEACIAERGGDLEETLEQREKERRLMERKQLVTALADPTKKPAKTPPQAQEAAA